MGGGVVFLQMDFVIRSVFVIHLVEQMASVLEGRTLDKTKRCLDCGRIFINWKDLVGLLAVLKTAEEAPVTIGSKLRFRAP